MVLFCSCLCFVPSRLAKSLSSTTLTVKIDDEAKIKLSEPLLPRVVAYENLRKLTITLVCMLVFLLQYGSLHEFPPFWEELLKPTPLSAQGQATLGCC